MIELDHRKIKVGEGTLILAHKKLAKGTKYQSLDSILSFNITCSGLENKWKDTVLVG